MPFEVSVAGKVFLLGEYAVLSGAPAWVTTLPPRFTLREESEGHWAPHPDSPAGRYLSHSTDPNSLEGLSFGLSFNDPLQGAGGVGASTAQFAALYFLEQLRQGTNPTAATWRSAWQTYQELQSAEQRGSGADLIAQWVGGVCEVEVPPLGLDPKVRSLSALWDWSGFLVFSTTQSDPARKVATHEHLQELSRRGGLPAQAVESLHAVVKRAQEAIAQDPGAKLKSPRVVGECLTQYAEILRRLDCEAPQTTEDRLALAQFPGVLGVKGCGALQADTVVVLWDRQNADPKLLLDLLATAEARGLKLLTDRLLPERGMTWNFRS